MTTANVMPSLHDLMQRRIDDGSTPGNRKDPYRLALVVEGGAMRGVFSAGMTAALEEMNLLRVFDDVVGASAGALGLPFLLAGQALQGTTLYARHLSNKRFINFFKIMQNKLMDLDYLVDEVMHTKYALDFDKLYSTGVNLKILTTDVLTGRPVLHTNPKTRKALKKVMKATAMIPGVSGHYVEHKNQMLADGCFSEYTPLNTALDDGATHALVLLNVPFGQKYNAAGMFGKRIIRKAFKKISSPMAETFYNFHMRDNIALKKLVHEPLPDHIAVCYPPQNAPRVTTLCRNKNLLWDGLETGYFAMCKFLGKDQKELPDLWQNLRS